MVKLFKIIIILTGYLSVNHGEISAQTTIPVTAQGQVFAEVISMYTATERAQMNFGRFSPGDQGGEIVLTPESTVSVLGSIFIGPGSRNAASFAVSGDVDAVFSISLPATPVVLTHTASARTMQVINWASNPVPGIGTGKLQNGSQMVYIGATLKVGTVIDNPVGIYSGSYSVTFDFN
jgi:hypothetical protein